MPKKAGQDVVNRTIKVVREVAQQIGFTGERGERARLAKALDEGGAETPSGGQWHYDKGGPIGLTRFIKAHMPEGLPVTATSRPADSQLNLVEPEAAPVPQELTPVTQTDEQPSLYGDSTQQQIPESVAQAHAMSETPTCETPEHTSPQSTTEIVESESVPQPSTMSPILPGEMPAHNVVQIDPKDAADLTELLTWWRERKAELDTMQTGREERPAFKRGTTVTKTVRMSDAMAVAAERYAHKHRAQTGGTFSGLCEWLIWKALGRSEKFVVQENTE